MKLELDSLSPTPDWLKPIPGRPLTDVNDELLEQRARAFIEACERLYAAPLLWEGDNA